MKKRLILVILAAVFLFFTSQAYDNKIFSQHFVDEEDNLVLGKYLLKGEKLYGDVFSHHQPLAYILSAGIQKTNPNSIYLLIKRHREAIILWSFIWSLLLVARFGLPSFLFILPYEIFKKFLFGDLFLAESLAVYPLIYLVSLIFQNKIRSIELLFVGFCFSLVALLLSPPWLSLVVIFILLTIRLGNQKVGWIIIGNLPLILLTLNFISLKDYINQAFLINFNYYIPITYRESWLISFIKAQGTPFLSFFSSVKESPILQITQLFSLLLIINSLILLKKDGWKIVLGILLVLGLTNIRYVEAGSQLYSGFHALPWFALLVFFSSYTTVDIWKKSLKFKFVPLVLVTLIFVNTILASKTLFLKHNLEDDFFVSYSRQFTFGEIVRIMKSEDDTLMVAPDEWLIYWQGDINHHTRMVNYYAWMSEVPDLRKTVEDGFEQNPPTYFYCECLGSYFGLEKYFDLYEPLKKDGDLTKLLVLKGKLKSLTEMQKNMLRYHNVNVD